MESTTQLKLKLATSNQLRKAWAFAVDNRGRVTRRKHSASDLKHYVINSCSAEAKLIGIRIGMRYEEAKLLFPEVRVLLVGAHDA